MESQVSCGDCLSVLGTLQEKTIQTCVTSPPYYGLRDYGVEEQIGLEDTPQRYIQSLVEVFREVRRVLRDDGTLWLNIGDSYSSHRDGKTNPDTSRGTSLATAVSSAPNRNPKIMKAAGLKHKDLIGIPWRLAFALRDDGWYLRQDIVWSKSNPRTERVRDRCTKAHEYIFLLAKSERYYFDHEAIREGCVSEEGSRNKRSVWTVATKPFKGGHVATFPPELIEPCVLAGSRKDDVVLDPFLGSGTTALVAKTLGRRYVGIEINPEYVSIAENRISPEHLYNAPTCATLDRFLVAEHA